MDPPPPQLSGVMQIQRGDVNRFSSLEIEYLNVYAKFTVTNGSFGSPRTG